MLEFQKFKECFVVPVSFNICILFQSKVSKYIWLFKNEWRTHYFREREGRARQGETVGGVCNFHSSVLPRHTFEMVEQCHTSVTAQSFIRQTKDSTPSRRGRADPKGKASILFLYILSPPFWACLMQIGLAKKGAYLFHLKFSLQSTDFLLFHFHRLFSLFVFQPLPSWTPFSYSNYLTHLKRPEWREREK